MQAFDNRGLLAEVFPDHLESWNFVQCLLEPKEMGNNRELIQNQTFGFFEHPYDAYYLGKVSKKEKKIIGNFQ